MNFLKAMHGFFCEAIITTITAGIFILIVFVITTLITRAIIEVRKAGGLRDYIRDFFSDEGDIDEQADN